MSYKAYKELVGLLTSLYGINESDRTIERNFCDEETKKKNKRYYPEHPEHHEPATMMSKKYVDATELKNVYKERYLKYRMLAFSSSTTLMETTIVSLMLSLPALP